MCVGVGVGAFSKGKLKKRPVFYKEQKGTRIEPMKVGYVLLTEYELWNVKELRY